ncbi:M36 family metallopeptidase [Gilvibacter sp.]|uniref:M36 family metallopeptidase n=1 Tax=Gilvibacter sp. TaxID=2729997 RepID=UPI003F49D9CE
MHLNYLTVSGSVKKALYGVFVFLIFGAVSTAYGQSRNFSLDQKLQELVENESLFQEDAAYIITAEHTSEVSGTHHVYFVQAINGIPVKGTESSIHINADGKLSNFNNKMIKNLYNQAQSLGSSSMTAEMAIQNVATRMVYSMTESLTQLERKENGVLLYSKAGISKHEIPTQLVYHYADKGGLSLAWELSIAETRSADWYNFFVDATTGDIVTKFNFTNYCDFGHDHSHDVPFVGPHEAPTTEVAYTPTMVVNAAAPVPAQYRVYAIPDESPNHSTGRVLVVNPENTNASPFGWHDTNGITGAEFTTTRGNNTNTYEDGDNPGFAPNGGASLDFDYTLTIPYTTTNQSESAAITNLFYWTNIIHDVLYEYGFTESAGNFQENNYGNGGSGSDSVNAEAQDGSGTCNANFGTPSDGFNPTMQMFVCDINGNGTFADGDFDNLVIAHEYGHGWSNRLTGGPAASGCLSNQEQMGEGWSDYLGLILTMKPGDASNTNRPVGTFLFEEPTTGGGIRPQPYNRENNTQTYNNITSASVPHGVGSVWATMLWEMTWDLIDVYGWDADIYNGTGGNNIALNLVSEAMKLQPCSPGFVDGRDAILQADNNIYGGANQCLIWDAFARRGLGLNADQGLSSSRSDGTEDFTSPSVSFALTGGDTFCVTEGVQTLGGGQSLSAGVYSGAGVTDNGDGTFDFDPNAAGVGTAVVTFTANNCDGSTATPTQNITVTDGNPVLVCQDATITLDGAGNATLVNADVIANLTPATGYTIDQTGTFAPLDISTGSTSVSLGDDQGTAAIALGFTFSFMGVDYTNVYITSNGYLAFDTNDLTDFSNDALPSTTLPDNMIAAVWDDYLPDGSETIRYKLEGTAPNRVFVVDYIDMPHWVSGGGGALNTFQVQLYEGSSRIEVHSTSITSDGGTRTQGIENVGGTEAYVVDGRNATAWTATNDYVAFVPNSGGLAENCGRSVGISLSKTDFTCADLGENIVTITADDGAGGITTCDVTVTIEGTGATFSGGSWDVTPTAGTIATIASNYDTAVNGDITSCSCEVDPLVTLTVGAGGTLSAVGNINVDGTLDVQHEGSVVQINDDAVVNNNGSIIVRKTSPSLDNRDFMIVGNPMTGSTRANTFGTAVQFRNHSTASFVPNPAVAAADPTAENWADDNGNNWVNYTGTINPAEGYLLMPQASPTVPDGATYNFVYDDGTLNNGVFTFTAGYNGSQNASANVTANPYASAIDAEVFIADNSAVTGSTIYFWNHISGPSDTYEGYNEANYDMGDISMYVATVGGTAAANGGDIPTQYIASGQGFGFKAVAAGTVTYENDQRVVGFNTGYKSFDASKVRLWLNIKNETYKLGSQMLVAFMEGASADYETQLDAKRLSTPVSLFSTLATGEQLTIQAREAFDMSAQIQVGFRSQIEENQLFTISLADIELGTLATDVDVFIEDRATGAITNLSIGNYSFAADAGLDDDRFLVFFEEKVLNTDDNQINNLSVVPNPTTGLVRVVAPSATIEAVEVRDIRGRLITNKTYTVTESVELDLTGLDTAIYFVKVFTTEGTIVKRVIKQ